MTVNVGIVGVGNCASSLVQGLAFYGVQDVRVVSALDVAPAKVGRDVSEAIFAAPNNALRFADVRPLGVTVQDGGSAEPTAIAAGWTATATEVDEDFRALEEPAALAAKQDTKTRGMGAASGVRSHVATSYMPHLADRKTAFIRVDALGYGETPIEIDVRMSLEDSPSAAPAILDAVRAAKAALDEGRGGVVEASARLMKAAPAG
jgi:myo-inositol-1-phosphate synthase